MRYGLAEHSATVSVAVQFEPVVSQPAQPPAMPAHPILVMQSHTAEKFIKPP
jgi:hypothetical protein